MDSGQAKELSMLLVHKGVAVKRFTPRAMGRATPKNNILTHVELVAQEI